MAAHDIIYTEKLEEMLRELFDKEEITPEFLNLIRVAVATHEHAYSEYPITKEKYLEWVSKAWDRGKQQRAVADMKIEGKLDNIFGISLGFGSMLYMHGGKEGYVSQPQNPKESNE